MLDYSTMANRPVRDTSGDITRMVLLGTLELGPAHGYEIKAKLARWYMNWWADVQSGAIYAALQRLEREGLVEKAGTERAGRRPVRTIFRITDAGSAELRRLVAEAWSGVHRFSRPIDVALSFYTALPPAEVKELLDGRLVTLRQLRRAFESDDFPGVVLGERQKQMVPDLRAHERLVLDAEISFTELVLQHFEQGAYGAP
jgi:DNA-binding PadR family transcriptional regulator